MGEIRLDHCCRLCLKEGFSLTNIFSHRSAAGDPLYLILNFIYEIKICESDGLPSQICSPCMWRMIEFDACKRNVHSAESEIMKLMSQTRPDASREVGVEHGAVNVNVPIKKEMDLEEWEMPVEAVIKAPERGQRFAIPDKDDYGDLESTEVPSESSHFMNSLTLRESIGNLEESSSVGIAPETTEMISTYEESLEKDVKENVIPSKVSATQADIIEKVVKSDLSFPVRNRKKVFICDICKKSFITKQKLGYHVRIHYDDRPFICNVCDKRFKHDRVRREHELRHLRDERKNAKIDNDSKEKPYSCGICGKNFSSNGGLHAHSNQHTNKYSCSYCGKSFGNNANLKKHLRIHTKEKPFKCELCCKSFSQKSTLNRHKSTHSSERPFPCNICAKKFKRKCEKDQHELIHFKRNEGHSYVTGGSF